MERTLSGMKEIAFQFDGDLEAKIFDVEIDAQSIVDDYKWMIQEIERYKKSLKFYADKENYEEWNEDSGLTEYIHTVDFDGGDIARKALEG